MKLEDLRIGSSVLYNGTRMSVYGLCSPLPNEDQRFDNKPILTLFGGEGLITCTFDEISPVPLTEELLLSMGFDKVELHLDKYGYRIEYYIEGCGWCVLCSEDFSSAIFSSYKESRNELGVLTRLNESKYLHGLENILFALNNKSISEYIL